MTDRYNSLLSPTKAEFKDRGSKFLAYAFPVRTESEINLCLSDIKKEHPKANHHCYAWRLGADKNRYRSNDDGEPSGTAGKPMLGQIDRLGLSDTLIIVVRYFGGTLLGTSGLINAYRESARLVLTLATITETVVHIQYRLFFDYSIMSDVMNALKKLNILVTKQEFTNAGLLEISIPAGIAAETVLQLKANTYHISVEEAKTNGQKDDLRIEIL